MRRSCVSCCLHPVPAPFPCPPALSLCCCCCLVLCRYLCTSLDQFRGRSRNVSNAFNRPRAAAAAAAATAVAPLATGLNDAKYVAAAPHRPLSQLAHSSHSFGAQFDPFLWICHQQNNKTVHKFHLFFNKVIFVVSINPSLCFSPCPCPDFCLCLCLSMSNNGRIRFRWPKKKKQSKK